MTGKIKKIVFDIGDKIADSMGVYLVDASFDKEKDGKFLRLYIDKAGGVGIDDCEQFSKAFENEFDPLNIIEDAYCLEVSSPGVDRILKTEREFLHYCGREVEVKLYSAVEGKKDFCGILKSFNDNTAVIEVNKKDIEIPLSQAVYIRLMFRF